MRERGSKGLTETRERLRVREREMCIHVHVWVLFSLCEKQLESDTLGELENEDVLDHCQFWTGLQRLGISLLLGLQLGQVIFTSVLKHDCPCFSVHHGSVCAFGSESAQWRTIDSVYSCLPRIQINIWLGMNGHIDYTSSLCTYIRNMPGLSLGVCVCLELRVGVGKALAGYVRGNDMKCKAYPETHANKRELVMDRLGWLQQTHAEKINPTNNKYSLVRTIKRKSINIVTVVTNCYISVVLSEELLGQVVNAYCKSVHFILTVA